MREDVSLYSIAKKCPPNFTGADMYALCADAWFHAAKRKVSPVSAIVELYLQGCHTCYIGSLGSLSVK